MVTFISRFRLSGIFNLNLLLFSVIRVKVLNDRWENGLSNQLMKHKLYQPRYDVYIIAVWKGETVVRKAASLENRVLAKRFHSQIHTSVSSCGLRLEKGDKYILTGHIIENKLFVSTCHWKQKWGKKAKKIRKYFKKKFSCNCDIQPCFESYCLYGVKTCSWHLSDHELPCSYKMCKHNEYGVCTWFKKDTLDMCD